MSFDRILGQFCKSGEWHKFSRRFHALTRTAKEIALQLIQSGVDPSNAIRQAKRTA